MAVLFIQGELSLLLWGFKSFLLKNEEFSSPSLSSRILGVSIVQCLRDVVSNGTGNEEKLT